MRKRYRATAPIVAAESPEDLFLETARHSI